MEIFGVTNTAATIKKSSSQTSSKISNPVASEYSKILAAKMSTIKEDIREMEEIRSQLDSICEMHEELTGEVKIDEDSGNANRDKNSSGVSITDGLETIKRMMPDGTIMITTYRGAEIVEQIHHRPHMVSTPDLNAPPNPDGTVATKLEPKQSLDLATLLMM
ncbi:MAG: hypothetical protein K6G55_02615 [Selenomonadaceae bacterium]|nr:hypothetical protein [Selenomonadaceae bacterium]